MTISLDMHAIILRSILIGALLGGCATPPQIEPGARPLNLLSGLPNGGLRAKLESCQNGPFYRTNFSIAHRGAPLGYAEHTEEGYRAAASMGAGLIECDVTFTKDLALVCRHSQCDLHRTTNILQTPLAANCTTPFTPATGDKSAQAKCCTSDITLAEFKTLCGRPDNVNPAARSVDAYLAARTTPVNSNAPICSTLLTHAESITLFNKLGVNFVPELKRPEVDMPFQPGFDQRAFADKMLNAYADIDASRVFPQSFDIQDVIYWIEQHPQFANQAVYLDGRGRSPDFKPSLKNMQALYDSGVRIIAPPMPMLLVTNEAGELQPSLYAKYARAAGLEIITWTFEAGSAVDPSNFMYVNIELHAESEMLTVLHALNTKVGIKGIFSDWPGTVTYYANCFDIKL